MRMPVVLTVAGSDSCAGAGIQADLRVFERLKAAGVCAVTCVTAQTPRRIAAITTLPAKCVAAQIRALSTEYEIQAAKTGALYSAAIVRAVAASLADCGVKQLVVDPVMVSSSGTRLLKADAVSVLARRLFPMAVVVTPNAREAEVLSGLRISGVEDAAAAAAALWKTYGVSCVVKGGHVPGGRGAGSGQYATDVLCHKGRVYCFSARRIEGQPTHGTGCAFSAAVAVGLARGFGVPAAVRRAHKYVHECLLRS